MGRVDSVGEEMSVSWTTHNRFASQTQPNPKR